MVCLTPYSIPTKFYYLHTRILIFHFHLLTGIHCWLIIEVIHQSFLDIHKHLVLLERQNRYTTDSMCFRKETQDVNDKSLGIVEIKQIRVVTNFH